MLNKSKKSMNKRKVLFPNHLKLYGKKKPFIFLFNQTNSFFFLSSAESAFDMLLKFEKNNTRMTIQDEMHKRFNDILRQYDNEVKKFNFKNLFYIFKILDHRN